MRTFVLFVAGFVVGTVVMNACGKKVEPPTASAVVEAVVQPATVATTPAVVESAVDAGVTPAVAPVTGGKMEAGTPTVQAVQTTVEQK